MLNEFFNELYSLYKAVENNEDATVSVKINGKEVNLDDIKTILNEPCKKPTASKVDSIKSAVDEYNDLLKKTAWQRAWNQDHPNQPACENESASDCSEQPSTEKYATTYEAPKLKIDTGTSVYEPSRAEDLLDNEEVTTNNEDVPIAENFITPDIEKDPDGEIYYLTPYVHKDWEVVNTPIEIPFSSYSNGKCVVGITDEQLVALLTWRFRFNKERSQIMDQLIQTFYGK